MNRMTEIVFFSMINMWVNKAEGGQMDLEACGSFDTRVSLGFVERAV